MSFEQDRPDTNPEGKWMEPPHRYITGLDAEGRSRILFNDRARSSVIWSTDASPADNSGTEDAGGGKFVFPERGTLFVYFDFPPGGGTEMHATDSIDYIIVISGEITFITEVEEVVVKAGEVLVDRGNMHGWRNHTDQTCRIMNVLCAARPVGKGATVSGEMDT
jgi:quercetin dioxygenase-like cupin family protein